jgi:hypothetical protein
MLAIAFKPNNLEHIRRGRQRSRPEHLSRHVVLGHGNLAATRILRED